MSHRGSHDWRRVDQSGLQRCTRCGMERIPTGGDGRRRHTNCGTSFEYWIGMQWKSLYAVPPCPEAKA